MRAKTITDFRKNIAIDIDQAVDDHEPLIIVRPNGKPAAVVMSLEDFSSWQETDYLLSTKANREHLLKSIAQAAAGEFVELKLPE